jgi:hypothetical protein
MVYVPMSYDAALELRAGHDPGPSRGCAVTSSLALALGPNTSTDEADFAALSNAGVLALTVGSDPQRLVLAIDVDPTQISDQQTASGEVEVRGLGWRQVQSLFTDEPPAIEAVAAARHAAEASVGLAEALSTPSVGQLLDTHDLLWFAVAELDQLG